MTARVVIFNKVENFANIRASLNHPDDPKNGHDMRYLPTELIERHFVCLGGTWGGTAHPSKELPRRDRA